MRWRFSLWWHIRLWRRWLGIGLILLLMAGGSVAQDEAAADDLRDPLALAAAYLGYEGEYPVPDLPPVYSVGDSETFWVAKRANPTPTRTMATLAALTRSIAIWVEDGIAYDEEDLREFALQLGQAFASLRLRDNYGIPLQISGQGALINPIDQMPLPDVDGDARIYILFTGDLGEPRDFVFNPHDSLPADLAPNGYSNQREILYVNTTPYSDLPLTDGIFFNGLLRVYVDLILTYNNPRGAPWLQEALGAATLRRLQGTGLTTGEVAAYFETPDTPLTRIPSLTNARAVSGGQELLWNYLAQRFGAETLRRLYLRGGEGVSALEAVIAASGLTDPATGAPVTFRDLFADFVLTNIINLPIGDGRFVHSRLELPSNLRASMIEIDQSEAEMIGQSVSQFGAVYYAYPSSGSGVVRLSFEGAETTARLPMPFDRAPEDRFYWSGGAANVDRTLTRTIDLTDVEAATLTFEAWYDLAEAWNYGYVSVSTDGGASWTTLAPDGLETENRRGLAYGAGFTGISNPAEPRPFPIMGVLIGADGMTVGEISAGGPAEAAGIRAGDRIIGWDEQEWPGTPNVIGLLSNYAPGDTLNLYIERGTTRLSIPVVLGAHPTRTVQPAPLWQPQTVDLSDYAGEEILLRFEYVSLPLRENGGFAIDNLAIEAIGWTDTADTPEGWTMNGWAQVDNRVPQRWLVQAVTTGTTAVPPRVRRLIAPDSTAHTGAWVFSLGVNEALLLAISGLNDDTAERASFDLRLSAEPV